MEGGNAMTPVYGTVPAVSIIVSCYNSGDENLLSRCLNSLINQPVAYEIIILSNGNVKPEILNKSLCIDDNCILLIEKQFPGRAALYNYGLYIAKGEYIFFIDSRDFIDSDSLSRLYHMAKNTGSDIVMGMLSPYPYDDRRSFSEDIPISVKNKVITGQECFISFMEADAYSSFMYNYLYRNEWIRLKGLNFNENIVYENELWFPIALYNSEKVLLTDTPFYYSANTSQEIALHERVTSLFTIASLLMRYTSRLSFYGPEGLVKGWWYTNVYRIYELAFSLLLKIQDSTFILPSHFLYTYCHIAKLLEKNIRIKCYYYYTQAKKGYKQYLVWYLKRIITNNLTWISNNRKKILLIYNLPEWYKFSKEQLHLALDDFIITTDRKYFSEANYVVFHMPDLHKYLDDDLTKALGQLWISWNMECEENHLWMKDPEITELFDITMDYHLASDIPCLYHRRFKEKLMQQQNPLEKQNKICMFISSPFNLSSRQEYILELMKYVEIDSYGAWLNNKTLMEDSGRSTKLDIYSRYKFVIAFENAIYPDYVTEKFYHPLLAGAVPIYMGAPNIETFIPGENCFVNVTDFKEPKELASFLKRCYTDNELYLNFHHWKKLPYKQAFQKQEEEQATDCLVRLCNLLKKKF